MTSLAFLFIVQSGELTGGSVVAMTTSGSIHGLCEAIKVTHFQRHPKGKLQDMSEQIVTFTTF